MVRVIKKCEAHKRRAACPNCHSELEYFTHEVQKEQVGMNDTLDYIICPVCGNKIYVV